MQNHGGNELRQWKKVKNRDQQSSPGIINIHDEPIFPDDIIIEIVSLLPAKDALRFRSVCKKFRDLIDLPYINRSVPMSVPMILVSNNYYYDHQQFLLDKCWEPESEYHKKSKIRSSDYPVQFSHDGLIVSYEPESPADVIIFNPIYSKNVKIIVPSENEILGVFYDQSVREYCTLWETTVSNSKPVKVQYKMLILGSPPYWREMKDPLWTQNKRMPEIRPVLVNNECLYWFVEREPRYKISNDPLTYKVDIMVMEFDTRTEGFKVIPCPIPTVIRDYSFFEGRVFNINLLNVNGLVLLVQISDKKSHLDINIWTLEDGVKKTWTSSEYSIKKEEIRRRSMSSKAVAFWNGELVIPYSSSKNKGLLVCNLKLGTTRILWSSCRDTPRCFVSHMMSFATLKNCKSIIFMLKRLRRMITE